MAMRRMLFFGALLTGTLLAGPSLASECQANLDAYRTDLMGDRGNRVLLNPELRSDMRDLQNAARILQSAGQSEACQDLVAAMKDMVEDAKGEAQAPTDYEDWQNAELERMKQAKTLAAIAGQIRAEEIIGREVRNHENVELGEIEDLMIETSDNKTSYAIVSHGGFLGIGESQIAVPLARLKVTEDRDVFVLNLTENQLENAPSLERDDFDLIADEAWRRSNEEYFKTVQ